MQQEVYLIKTRRWAPVEEDLAEDVLGVSLSREDAEQTLAELRRQDGHMGRPLPVWYEAAAVLPIPAEETDHGH